MEPESENVVSFVKAKSNRLSSLVSKTVKFFAPKKEASMYVDANTLTRVLETSPIGIAFFNAHYDTNMMKWEWDIRDGHLYGITLTAYSEEVPPKEE